MDNLKTIVRRIERRLEIVGKNPTQASREAGLSESAIYNLQRGAKGKIPTKGGNASTFVALAPVLGTTPGWLMTGDGGEATTVPVVGYIGAGQEFHPIDDHAKGAGIDEVPALPGLPPDAVALEIRGDSMHPRYFDGEVLFYRRDQRPPSELLGYREHVVQLKDGRILVKRLRPGTKKNRFHLWSYNAELLEDQEVEWAAPVLGRISR